MNVSPTKIFMVAEPVKVMFGGKSKLTITVLDTEATLPATSETE